ncbi:hypothetical protein [Parvularcula dongshanensis]|uniref:Putative membrane protein n=1 Tax=Parvularcula dongshanensis TaxID=1173995 RepID=A0A840I121_9PROT|nr:hypothetical protein [Parvularcula dongshanensis]MBB4657888.1 putative membrane protein [Parvularcula dongshanensis]
MPFREKTLWVQLIALAAVAAYFAYDMHVGGGVNGSPPAGMIGAVIAFVVLMVVLMIPVAALTGPSDREAAKDERDREAERRGEAGRANILVLCVLATLLYAATHGEGLIANALFLSLLLAQAAGALMQILHYRRTA